MIVMVHWLGSESVLCSAVLGLIECVTAVVMRVDECVGFHSLDIHSLCKVHAMPWFQNQKSVEPLCFVKNFGNFKDIMSFHDSTSLPII